MILVFPLLITPPAIIKLEVRKWRCVTLSIIKSLAIDYKAAGMAKYFLGLCNTSPEMIKVDELIIDLKKILVLLNVRCS